jgi:hypothetical protein
MLAEQRRLYPALVERLPEPRLIRGEMAVLVVDMQYGDAHRDHGLLRSRREAGQAAEIEYYR